MDATEKPGEIIKHKKNTLVDSVLGIVTRFEDATDVKIQSVHYYRTEPDPKLLDDQGKQRVDIVLNL